MSDLVFDVPFEVTTPMFLGVAEKPSEAGFDADQWTRGLASQFVPSLRGALRFWFRALAGASYGADLKGLFAAEAAVFGASAEDGEPSRGRSAVRMRVIGWDVRLDGGTNGDWKRPMWLGDRPRSDKPNHMTYLVGQGLAGLPNRAETPNKPFLTRPAIGIGSKITVRFTAISQESWIPTRNALWALLRFGGLGSRSGRGFGRVQAQTDPTGLSILDHPDWHDLAFIRDNLGVTNLRRFEDFPQQGTYPNFREGCYRITDLGTLGSSWATCSIELGYRWRVARASTPAPTAAYMPKAKTPEWLDFVKHKPMRSGEFPLEALGLPVVYQSRNSFDWGVSRTVNLHDSSDLSRELRQKSPILFAIDKVTTPTAGWKATALAFYTEIPPGVTLRLTEKRPKDDPSPVPAPVSLQTGDARARLDQAMTDLANPQIPR